MDAQFRERRDAIMGIASLLDYDTVLDLGCLKGSFSFEFAKLGKQVVGVDIRQKSIDEAELKKKELGLDVSFKVGDALDVKEYADLVLCAGILYHLANPFKLIEQMDCKYAIIDTHVCPDGIEIAKTANGETRKVSNVEYGGNLYQGIIFKEHNEGDSLELRESRPWSSLHNTTSLWLTHSSLVKFLENHFSVVLKHEPDLVLNKNRVVFLAKK
jgi:2-polyprenyl-3-methyl-5-hydroxy-6-metoxy-1,4-benzoquinol methylase